MGGRGSVGTRGQQSYLTEDDWNEWSEDPSIFQRIERGDDVFRDLYEYYEDEAEENYTRIKGLADAMQREAGATLKNVDKLYRGERYDTLEEAQQRYAVGNVITARQLTSYSTDKALAIGYAKMYGDRKVSVVITNTAGEGKLTGVRATHTGYSKNEDPEVIVARGTQSVVTGVKYDKKTNTLYVKTKRRTR